MTLASLAIGIPSILLLRRALDWLGRITYFSPGTDAGPSGRRHTSHSQTRARRSIRPTTCYALSFHEPIDHIWGPAAGDREMLRQLVRRLRAKIEPSPSQPTLIENVPGQGYGLVGERGQAIRD